MSNIKTATAENIDRILTFNEVVTILYNLWTNSI